MACDKTLPDPPAQPTVPAGDAIVTAGRFPDPDDADARRRQTIQALSDSYYRACESYLAGTLSRSQYDRLLETYDLMVAELAATGPEAADLDDN